MQHHSVWLRLTGLYLYPVSRIPYPVRRTIYKYNAKRSRNNTYINILYNWNFWIFVCQIRFSLIFILYYLCKLFVQSYVLKAYQLLKLILFYYNTLLISIWIMSALITHAQYTELCMYVYKCRCVCLYCM